LSKSQDVSATGNLAYIVGRGASGPQAGLPDLLRLRALGAAARLRVVVAEGEGDCAARLGGSVPVLVAGGDAAWEDVAEELDDAFLGDAELWRRGLEPGAGPRGGDLPYVDAGGRSILDLRFPEDGLRLLGEPAPYAAIAAEIEGVAGVAAHGLVAGGADAAVVAGAEGAVVVERAECMAAE
jgi:ribose 5-phosphate isomerase A